MFQTFDKAKLCGKPSADKQALDPFGELQQKTKMVGSLTNEFENFSNSVMGGNSKFLHILNEMDLA